jgi:cell division control protein 7
MREGNSQHLTRRSDRVFICNVPSVTTMAHANLHELVRALNPNIHRENRPFNATDADVAWYDGSELWAAVDLMKRCLALDCTRRITAAQALRHPFFMDYHKVAAI